MRFFVAAAIELDQSLTRGAELINDRHVFQGVVDSVGVAVGWPETLAVALDQACGGSVACRCFAQPVAPGLDNGGDAIFQPGPADVGCAPLVAADDVMGAGQRPFWIGGVSGGDAPLVDIGEPEADLAAHLRIVAVLRHIDQQRDKAVEAIDAGERPEARPVAKRHDVMGEAFKLLGVDLEKLVAGIALQHIGKRAGRIAVLGIASFSEDEFGLAPDIGHAGDGIVVGGRRQQSDDAQLPRHTSLSIESLDADIVHMDPPVDQRFHIGLGDDQGLRFAQEGENFRRHGEIIAPAPQHIDGRIAQDAQARTLLGLGHRIIGCQRVFAHPQQRHVIGAGPCEKGDGLCDILLGMGRGIGGVGRDGVFEAQPHRAKIHYCLAHMGIDLVETGDQISGLCLCQQGQMDMDETLACPRHARFRQAGLAHQVA